MPSSWLGMYDAPDLRGGSLFAACGVFVFGVLFFALGRILGRLGFQNRALALVAANPLTVGLAAMTVRWATMDRAPMEFGQSCFFHPFIGWLAYAHLMSTGMRPRSWQAGLILAGLYTVLTFLGGLLLDWWVHPR